MLENRLQPVLDPHALARALSNKLLIDGTMLPASAGRSFSVVNPATLEAVAEAAEGDAAGVWEAGACACAERHRGGRLLRLARPGARPIRNAAEGQSGSAARGAAVP